MYKFLISFIVVAAIVAGVLVSRQPTNTISIGGPELAIQRITSSNPEGIEERRVLECLFSKLSVNLAFTGVGRNQLENLAANGAIDALYPIAKPSPENNEDMVWIGPLSKVEFSWFALKDAGSDVRIPPSEHDIIASTAGGTGPKWLRQSGYSNILELRMTRDLFGALYEGKAKYALTISSHDSGYEYPAEYGDIIVEFPAFDAELGLELSSQIQQRFPNLAKQLNSNLNACAPS